jgi:hypothetical protein
MTAPDVLKLQHEVTMNIFLWALQIILAIKLLSVTLSHGLRQSMPSLQEARRRLGAAAPPLLALAALGCLLGALGVTLPGLLGAAGWITPLTAALIAAMLLVSILLHIRSRDKPKVFVSLVLLAFAVMIAYGRWALAP